MTTPKKISSVPAKDLDPDLFSDFEKKLNYLLLEGNRKQNSLAKEIGVSTSHFTRIINGLRPVTKAFIEKFNQAFNVFFEKTPLEKKAPIKVEPPPIDPSQYDPSPLEASPEYYKIRLENIENNISKMRNELKIIPYIQHLLETILKRLDQDKHP